MQLPDPYQLMGHDPAEAGLPDAATLRRAQRRILAQFELSGEVEIEINGVLVDRNMVLRSLEQLEDPKKAEELASPYKNPALRKLLTEPGIETLISLYERGEIRISDVPLQMQEMYIKEMDAQVRSYWQSGNFDGIIRLLRMARNLSERGHSRAARSLNRLLPALTKELEARAEAIRRDKSAGLAMNKDYERLAGLGLIRLVNYLDGYFEEYKVPYRRALLACAHAMYTWPSCHAYLGQYIFALENLDSDNFFRYQVRQLRQRVMNDRQGNRKGLRTLAVIAGPVILCLFLLFVIANLSGGSESGSGFWNYDSPSYDLPDLDFDVSSIRDIYREATAQEVKARFYFFPTEAGKVTGEEERPMNHDPSPVEGMHSSFRLGSFQHRLDIRNAHPEHDLIVFVVESPDSGALIESRYLYPGAETHVYPRVTQVDVYLYAGTGWHPKTPGFAHPALKEHISDVRIRARAHEILTYEAGREGVRVGREREDASGIPGSNPGADLEKFKEENQRMLDKLNHELDSMLKGFEKEMDAIISDTFEFDPGIDQNLKNDSLFRP